MPTTSANQLAALCAYSTHAPEWEQLVRLVTPSAALVARRVGAIWGDTSAATTHEIVQEVFLKLCENDRRVLREFKDRGADSFRKLVRMMAASVATDHFRRICAEKRGGGLVEQTPESVEPPDLFRFSGRSEIASLGTVADSSGGIGSTGFDGPVGSMRSGDFDNLENRQTSDDLDSSDDPDEAASLAYPVSDVTDAKALDAVLRPALIAQLDGLLRCFPETVSARDRNLFWLYYRHGMTTRDIARIPSVGLSSDGVESAISRLIRLLRDTIATGKQPPAPLQRKLKVETRRKALAPALASNESEGR